MNNEYKSIKMHPATDAKLTQMSMERKKNGNLVNTKQSIIQELVEAQYKKEVKAK